MLQFFVTYRNYIETFFFFWKILKWKYDLSIWFFCLSSWILKSFQYKHFTVFATNWSKNLWHVGSICRNFRIINWVGELCCRKKITFSFNFFFRCNRTFSTEVESASQSPVWGAKHVFSDIEREELLYAKLDITVWNFSHAPKHECIGKILVWLHFFKDPQIQKCTHLV